MDVEYGSVRVDSALGSCQGCRAAASRPLLPLVPRPPGGGLGLRGAWG